MSHNRLFLISFGCLLIVCSYLMKQPIFLIVTGIVLIAAAFWKPKKSAAPVIRKKG